MRPELQGLAGGAKQQWLRLHRQTVLDFLSGNGPEKTMVEFAMGQATFERFLQAKSTPPDKQRMAQRAFDRAMQAIDGLYEQRDEIDQIKKRLDRVEPICEMGYALARVLQIAGQLPAIMNKPPTGGASLKLNDFDGSDTK